MDSRDGRRLADFPRMGFRRKNEIPDFHNRSPGFDKLMILSTLAYLVLPIDIIKAKRLPIIGWIDEVASLAVAIKKVRQHITPEVEQQADEVLDRWFAEYTEYEELPD